MVFVGLHELGHVCTESVGHGPDFWNNFGWLLKEAEGAGEQEVPVVLKAAPSVWLRDPDLQGFPSAVAGGSCSPSRCPAEGC